MRYQAALIGKIGCYVQVFLCKWCLLPASYRYRMQPSVHVVDRVPNKGEANFDCRKWWRSLGHFLDITCTLECVFLCVWLFKKDLISSVLCIDYAPSTIPLTVRYRTLVWIVQHTLGIRLDKFSEGLVFHIFLKICVIGVTALGAE